MLNNAQKERYSRQVSLTEIGETGQQKLLSAKVLVVGAGGLGCPVLQYLTAAGAGTIGVIDHDIVSLSNLHRQVLFSTADIGKSKALTAIYKLQHLNSDVQFRAYNYHLTALNAWNIISDYDLIIDGSDNFATRYLVNDTCVLLQKPLVYGSVFRFEGQVAFFNVDGSANYRDLFAEPPAAGEVPNCAEAGVMGVLPGIIGNLMANEGIKFLTGTGQLLTNRLLTYQSQHNVFYEVNLQPGQNNQTNIPVDRLQLEQWQYEEICAIPVDTWEIPAADLDSWVDKTGVRIIDVREEGEWPQVTEFEHENLALSQLKIRPHIFNGETIVLFCQSGTRSREAAQIISTNNPYCTIYSLKGGILQWKKEQEKTP